MPEDEAAPAELVVLICLSYATFLLAEFAKLSGIVAALFGGSVSVIYVKRNLSPAGSKLCKTVVSGLAKFTETIVFLLIGYGFWLFMLGHTRISISVLHPEVQDDLADANFANSTCLPPEVGKVNPQFIVLTIAMCLLSRMASTFPLTWIVNRLRQPENRISINEQCVMWFSGLRGAIALALAVEFPTADEVGEAGAGSFCYQRDHVVSCTIVVVLFSVFVMGGLTKPVLNLAGVQMKKFKEKKPMKLTHKFKWKNTLRWMDSNVIRPILVCPIGPPTHSRVPKMNENHPALAMISAPPPRPFLPQVP